MKFQLRLLGKSRSDLEAARLWLTQRGSGFRGRARYGHITEALLDLESSPLRWPFSDHSQHRERTVEGYRIVYRVFDHERRVEVLRIFGPYQNRSEP